MSQKGATVIMVTTLSFFIDLQNPFAAAPSATHMRANGGHLGHFCEHTVVMQQLT